MLFISSTIRKMDLLRSILDNTNIIRYVSAYTDNADNSDS